MTDSANSHWKDPTKAVNNLDISYLVVFTLQIVCDIILIWGAFKKIPHHAVPWLWANAIIIAVFLVSFKRLKHWCWKFWQCPPLFLFFFAADIHGKYYTYVPK